MKWPTPPLALLLALALWLVAFPGSCLGQGTSITYTYNGPSGTATTQGDHVRISFTVSSPLAANTSYLSTASANVVPGSGYVDVITTASTLPFMTLPLSTFQLHTNQSGGIDSWFILGDITNTVGNPMSGTHQQAYSMNTLRFIPGSDVPGSVGLVTGAYDYDQATITTFYTSCSVAPPGQSCQLAGNSQPYVSNYGWNINPSNTDGSWWQVSSNYTGSPVPIVSTTPTGSPAPTTAVTPTAAAHSPAVSPTHTASSPSHIPSSRAPSPAATSPSHVPTTVTRSPAAISTSASPSRSPASSSSHTPVPLATPLSCSPPPTATQAQGQATVVAVGVRTMTLAGTPSPVLVHIPPCAAITYNDATSIAVNQIAEWSGYYSAATGNVANVITIN